MSEPKGEAFDITGSSQQSAAATSQQWVLAADRVITPHRTLTPGWVAIDGETISAVGLGAAAAAPGSPVSRLAPGLTLIPGLVDMHVHGAGGGDMTAPDDGQIHSALRALGRRGITSCVASLVTAPEQDLTASLELIDRQVRSPEPGVARLLGAHLEGPFLSTRYRGAHDEPSLCAPDIALFRRLIAAGCGSIRMMTIAPELDGALDLIAVAREEGIAVGMGHTGATFDTTQQAIAAGVRVATHLFNGMRQPHHREPGPALSLLDDARVTIELINDGHHVHPAVARVACRAAGDGRLALISDAVAATAAPEGRYRLGRVVIRNTAGQVRTDDDSSLGGGGCTLDESLRRGVTVLGLTLEQATAAATAVPAAALGVDRLVGSLDRGRRADICALDAELRVVKVMMGGQWIP